MSSRRDVSGRKPAAALPSIRHASERSMSGGSSGTSPLGSPASTIRNTLERELIETKMAAAALDYEKQELQRQLSIMRRALARTESHLVDVQTATTRKFPWSRRPASARRAQSERFSR